MGDSIDFEPRSAASNHELVLSITDESGSHRVCPERSGLAEVWGAGFQSGARNVGRDNN